MHPRSHEDARIWSLWVQEGRIISVEIRFQTLHEEARAVFTRSFSFESWLQKKVRGLLPVSCFYLSLSPPLPLYIALVLDFAYDRLLVFRRWGGQKGGSFFCGIISQRTQGGFFFLFPFPFCSLI